MAYNDNCTPPPCKTSQTEEELKSLRNAIDDLDSRISNLGGSPVLRPAGRSPLHLQGR